MAGRLAPPPLRSNQLQPAERMGIVDDHNEARAACSNSHQGFFSVLLDEGAKHSRYINLADPSGRSTVPRHAEIADLLA